jgi:AraC-like DNA-binding protein
VNSAATTITLPPAVADYPVGARTGRRVIGDHELVWMTRGWARFFAPDEGEMALRPGLLLLVPPGRLHEFAWDEQRPCRHGYVHFRPRSGTAPTQASIRPMTEHDPLAGLCSYLLWLGAEQPPSWEAHAGSALGYLLEVFTDAPVPSEPERGWAGPLARVVEHLRREWNSLPLRPIGVGELAAVAHVSRSYLARLCVAELGMPTNKLLERLRCSRAESLLTRTDLPIGAIGRQCAFADPFHFSHRFATLYGMSPRAYRSTAGSTRSVLDDPIVRRMASQIWG